LYGSAAPDGWRAARQAARGEPGLGGLRGDKEAVDIYRRRAAANPASNPTSLEPL